MRTSSCLQDQAQYWFEQSTPHKLVTPEQFSELFKQSTQGRQEHERLDAPFDEEAQKFDVRQSCPQPPCQEDKSCKIASLLFPLFSQILGV